MTYFFTLVGAFQAPTYVGKLMFLLSVYAYVKCNIRKYLFQFFVYIVFNFCTSISIRQVTYSCFMLLRYLKLHFSCSEFGYIFDCQKKCFNNQNLVSGKLLVLLTFRNVCKKHYNIQVLTKQKGWRLRIAFWVSALRVLQPASHTYKQVSLRCKTGFIFVLMRPHIGAKRALHIQYYVNS